MNYTVITNAGDINPAAGPITQLGY